jgi:hypothetical protein
MMLFNQPRLGFNKPMLLTCNLYISNTYYLLKEGAKGRKKVSKNYSEISLSKLSTNFSMIESMRDTYLKEKMLHDVSFGFTIKIT